MTTVTKEHRFYKWYILSLVVMTNMVVAAIPSMAMSVLAKEISQDLGLNLVQVGMVWGVGSLPGIITGLLGGAIGDKIGPKRVILVGSLLASLAGIGRALAPDFISLMMMVILAGALTPFVTMNGMKACGVWFPPRLLGLATGLISMGMALGFLIGSLVSATLLSPALGGWRQVFILYAVIGMFLSVPWFFTRSAPASHPAATAGRQLSVWQAVSHVARLKNIWLLGLAIFGVGGCIQAILGYLPLYLRAIGWDAFHADGALSAFHTISMTFVLPISMWSDRLGRRKPLLMAAASLVILGTSLLSVASGNLIWAAVLMTGMVRDAFMAIFMTMIIETEGVGATYAGTAIGFVMAMGGLGTFAAPPLGNSLAPWGLSLPFVFWAGLACLGLVGISFTNGLRANTENGG